MLDSGGQLRPRVLDGTLYVFERVVGTRFHDLRRIEDRFGNFIRLAHDNDEHRFLRPSRSTALPETSIDFVPDSRGRIERVPSTPLDELGGITTTTSTI